jgi:hypothetical protein
VDILVNNAAVYSFQPLEEITEGEFRRHYDTNVLGPILTLQEYLKHAPTQGGSVVNVVTAGLSANGPGSALYTSTKGALTTVTKIAANELGARGIRVNAIAPGATDTEGARELGLIGGDMVEQLTSSTPFGRIDYLEDIGPVAAFLLRRRPVDHRRRRLCRRWPLLPARPRLEDRCCPWLAPGSGTNVARLIPSMRTRSATGTVAAPDRSRGAGWSGRNSPGRPSRHGRERQRRKSRQRPNGHPPCSLLGEQGR